MSPLQMDKKTLGLLSATSIIVAILIFLIGYFIGKHSNSITENECEESNGISFDTWRRRKAKCEELFTDSSTSTSVEKSTLILISFDGFRPDYVDRSNTPALNHLFECGTRAKFMRSVYPSKTFPNHYTLVTGLYPESHGIIANKMYDPKTKKFFKMSSIESEWWGGEPFWITLEKQNRTSAVFFAPGSETKIKGYRPRYYRKYQDSTAFETRVDTVLSWIDLPTETRPEFILLYFHEPDKAGHTFGVESEEVNKALSRLDKMIDRLMDGLYQRMVLGNVNMILTSDHGMQDTKCNDVINIHDLIDVNDSEMKLFGGVPGRIRVFNSTDTVKLDKIKARLTCSHPNMRIYNQDNVPVRLHYSNNRRIDDLILDTDPGYVITSSCWGKATHGYDPLFNSMKTFFIGYGPAFKRNITVEPFENIEVYNLMSDILKIQPAPNNGTLGSLHHLLSNPPEFEDDKKQIVKKSKCLNSVSKFQCVCDKGLIDCSSNCKKSEEDPIISDKIEKTLLPFGDIVNTKDDFKMDPSISNDDVCNLLHQSYVIAYDKKLKSPIWVSFQYPATNLLTTSASQNLCLQFDERILDYEQLSCAEFHDLSSKKDIIMKSLIPENKRFTHSPLMTDFIKVDDWLWRNSARVKDIELLTGLLFYSDLKIKEKIRLSTQIPILENLLEILQE
ncbi:Ectonucleotide pyrophosphatase/phosphodiesterase family member 3 [Nymphon striatum]|nr:Ectonucleotide pyrophosphatase/phosphodiesterase family member 3 [Nymphon striatum]